MTAVITSQKVPAVFGDQRQDPTVQFVRNVPNGVHCLALGVGERPVVPLRAWHHWTRIATSHGDEPLRLSSEFGGQLLWPLLGQVDAVLAHQRDHFGMHPFSRLRAGGNGSRLRRIGVAIEQGSGDLRSPGIVHARKQDGDHEALRATRRRRSSVTLTAVCDNACSAATTTAATTGLSIGVRR